MAGHLKGKVKQKIAAGCWHIFELYKGLPVSVYQYVQFAYL